MESSPKTPVKETKTQLFDQCDVCNAFISLQKQKYDEQVITRLLDSIMRKCKPCQKLLGVFRDSFNCSKELENIK